jgi:hypothetical protein
MEESSSDTRVTPHLVAEQRPSINQTQFKADQAWAAFVTQRDLGGVATGTCQGFTKR